MPALDRSSLLADYSAVAGIGNIHSDVKAPAVQLIELSQVFIPRAKQVFLSVHVFMLDSYRDRSTTARLLQITRELGRCQVVHSYRAMTVLGPSIFSLEPDQMTTTKSFPLVRSICLNTTLFATLHKHHSLDNCATRKKKY